MDLMMWNQRRSLCRLLPRLIVAVLPSALLLIAGCPGTTPSDPTPDGTPSAGPTTGRILSYSTNFSLTVGGTAVTVLYEISGAVPSSVAAFYVAVTDISSGAEPADDALREPIATDLPASGGEAAFTFDPTLTGVGFFRVGISWVVGGIEYEAFSVGAIIVEEGPSPIFVQPSPDGTTIVADGGDVTISFDSGVSEGDIHWRLFYLPAGDPRTDPIDERGTTIGVGTGRTGTVVFSTLALAPGDYELGVSVTSSGMSIEDTAQPGVLGTIVTTPSGAESGPIIQIPG